MRRVGCMQGAPASAPAPLNLLFNPPCPSSLAAPELFRRNGIELVLNSKVQVGTGLSAIPSLLPPLPSVQEGMLLGGAWALQAQ